MHGAALRADRTVVCWGRNDYGQSTVPSGLRDVKSVVASGHDTFALKADGTVVAWGASSQGQLYIPEGLSDVAAIAATDFSVLALRKNGAVVAWGSSSTVPEGLKNVVGIYATPTSAFAVKADGAVVAWGDKQYGQLSIPQLLPGQRWLSIRGGWQHVFGMAATLTPTPTQPAAAQPPGR